MKTRSNQASHVSKARRNLPATGFSEMQGLEPRTMMSANPLGVSVVKNVLTINGSAYNDSIMVTRSANRWTVSNGTWRKVVVGNFSGVSVNGNAGNDLITVNTSVSETLIGGAGNDSLIGGSGNDVISGGAGDDREVGMNGNDWMYGSTGNDRMDGGNGDDNLFGGAGNDYLVGGNGDDVVVSVGGGGYDSVFGSAGTDSFWTDANTAERIYDASYYEQSIRSIHRISNFATEFGYSVSKELNGQDLDDPILATMAVGYKDFGANDLFASGDPSINDVNQGYLGDCYFLSQLASYAITNPQIIRQAVVDLGDGTFAVRFENNGTDSFYRVDGDLPVDASGKLVYANLGAKGAVWVAVMEKAWAFARQGDGNYSSIEAGYTGDVANALGMGAEFNAIPSSGDELLDQIEAALDDGESVTIATLGQQASNSPMVGDHAYTAVAVVADASGNRWLIVRNPWGIDGNSSRDGSDDGYVAINAQEAFNTLDYFVVADA